jgi:capsular exopolysaccharide synthesis family protein
VDFLYQAIKKEAGVEEVPTKQAAVELLPEREAPAGASKVSAPISLPDLDRPKKIVPRRKSFEVKHPVNHLVAFLSHPVLEPNIAAMEQCRVLRARLREIITGKKIRTLLLTSATQGEGKTLLSVNLAYALSQIDGMKVLLVDADLRRPSVANFLKMGKIEGLNRYLLDQAKFDEVCWKLTPSLDVVPTAELREDSAELLHGDRMREFLAEASANYGVVLLDGPPMFPIVDAQVVSHLVDGVVLVVRADKTPFDLVRQAADLLKQKLVGSILNGVERLADNHYYGGYAVKAKKK